ncbi:MAG: phosphatidate cytidylyltransferase [Acidobacteria bacterium]|nr:phosphatidate cytidylyltransferase [Acidobacteriota bacterium]
MNPLDLEFRIGAEELLLAQGVLALLLVASLIGFVLSRTVKSEAGKKTVQNMNQRIAAWWAMVAVFFGAVAAGWTGTNVLFLLISFLALREFMTLTPTRPSDHGALLWVFFVITPLQYFLVWSRWYGLFSVFIPVWAFLAIPTRLAIAGEPERFLERAAKVQWGLMVSVFCVSHAPALLLLEIPGYEGQTPKLLFFLIAIAQLSDVFQYVFGKLFGKHKIAPVLSPNKTVEGFVGGVATVTLLGALLSPFTPFPKPIAALLALAIALMGFAGGLVMSAIKRDRGVKDYGNLIAGHGGILDRIDSICFAAPVFFHLVRYFYTP